MISDGDFNMILEEDDNVLAYTREYKNTQIIVLNNFYGEMAEIKLSEEFFHENNKILISNYKDSMELSKNIKLRPYESIVYLIEK